MIMLYFGGAFLLTFVLSPVIREIMRRYGVIDRPGSASRKSHKKNIPHGGGIAIAISFCVILILAIAVFGDIGDDIRVKNIVGLLCGIVVLLIGGFLDDKYNLPPRKQLVFPIFATLVVIAAGIGLQSVTNPTGGVLYLNQIQIPIEGLGRLVLFADLLVFIWLMGMMYSTKLLDGLDGLVTGVVSIGAVMIFVLASQPPWIQPEVALISIIFAGASLGFLPWNFVPAKMFLGEGGSLLMGFVLAFIALVSGSKIATTLLVMGVPLLDMIRVVIVRVTKKKPPFVGDSEHLHFRLLESGLSKRQTVFLFYSIAFLFGISTLFLQQRHQVVALALLFLLMLLVGVWFSREESTRTQ